MTPAGHTSRRALVAAAVAAFVLCLPTVASAGDPALDEYTLRGPDAKGEGNVGSSAPRAQPKDLPAEVREALAQDPDGEILATIATAKELGAPEPPVAGGGASPDTDNDDPSTLAAAGNALDSPASLALIAVVVLAAIAGAVAYSRRRGT